MAYGLTSSYKTWVCKEEGEKETDAVGLGDVLSSGAKEIVQWVEHLPFM